MTDAPKRSPEPEPAAKPSPAPKSSQTQAASPGPADPDETAPVAPPDPAPKLDPETLAIRSAPVRAIRFRRGVVIAIAALGSLSLMAVAWLALRSHAFHQPSDQVEASPPNAKPPSEVLNGLPANYGAVPKLGPPLPGDLGKPILEQQQSSMLAESNEARQVEHAAAAEQERAAAEIKSARESAVLVHGAAGDAVAAPVTLSAEGATAMVSDAPSKLALDPTTDPNAQQHKTDFVAARDRTSEMNPHPLTTPPSPYLLSAGSVIAASLITGLRSDLPGMVTAQVTENVYDSPTGRILLVPQGARLIGKYDSVVVFGQKRALVVWQRLILPDGGSIALDNMPAGDPAGYAGLQDKVDMHTWQLLKGAAISTLLGVGADLQFSGNGGLVEAIRQSGQQNASRVGDQLTAKELDVQPTLTIRPGAPVRLLVDRDLILAPWHG